jgi:hypothetical protein
VKHIRANFFNKMTIVLFYSLAAGISCFIDAEMDEKY